MFLHILFPFYSLNADFISNNLAKVTRDVFEVTLMIDFGGLIKEKKKERKKTYNL